MNKTFDNGDAALTWFRESLIKRGFVIKEIGREKTKAGAGRYVYPVRIETTTNEVFIVKFWNDKWVPSTKISRFAEDLDERYRFAIKAFGKDDPSATSMNSDLLLRLLELGEKGYQSFIVTIYGDGDVLYCSAQEMYEFTTSYGTLQQYTNDPTLIEALSCRVPTGWLHRWSDPIEAFPTITEK